MKGVATFTETGIVEGYATFEDKSSGLHIEAVFTKLPKGDHGFHIHTNGDLRGEGCMGACSHYNKGPKRNHGGPPGSKGDRHTGDLGNVSQSGHTYNYRLPGVTVSELLGRTLIVHGDPDDLGKGQEEDSLTTGHAGKRIACAIIGRAKDCSQTKTRKSRKLSED
jgi:Cu-Zn family superoxide dismutase